jgi:hypothetical protein
MALFYDAVSAVQKATSIKTYTGMPGMAVINLPGKNPGYAMGDKVVYKNGAKSFTSLVKAVADGQGTSQVTPLNTYSLYISVANPADVAGLTGGTVEMAPPTAIVTTTTPSASTSAVNAQPPVISASTIKNGGPTTVDPPAVLPVIDAKKTNWLMYAGIAIAGILVWKYGKKIFKGK